MFFLSTNNKMAESPSVKGKKVLKMPFQNKHLKYNKLKFYKTFKCLNLKIYYNKWIMNNNTTNIKNVKIIYVLKSIISYNK